MLRKLFECTHFGIGIMKLSHYTVIQVGLILISKVAIIVHNEGCDVIFA